MLNFDQIAKFFSAKLTCCTVPGGRSLVRYFIHWCVICRRYNTSYYRPPPPLPAYRVQGGLAFSSVGVDYAGPMTIKHYTHTSHNINSHTKSGARNAYTSCEGKAWVCLFTCCASRAVHLDVVIDLTSRSFIRCFKRFISRRGLPARVVSDNGSTFKASARTLQEIFANQEVKRFLSNYSINWIFNVERAPWWGGFFERLIQSLKRCLKKMIGRARLTYEELVTEVAEVKLILNSRPLTYLSADDVDEPLTPSHLICGTRLLSLPDHLCYNNSEDEDYQPHSSATFTRRVKYLRSILDRFWTRWRQEYLLELRESHRRLEGRRPDKVNVRDVVIIYDDIPRGLWKLGVIEKTIMGRDREIRGAIVRVGSGSQSSSFLRRPIQRLYPLELRSVESSVNEQISHSEYSDDTQADHSVDSTNNVETNSVCPSAGAENVEPESGNTTDIGRTTIRPRRKAATEARDRIAARLLEGSD